MQNATLLLLDKRTQGLVNGFLPKESELGDLEEFFSVFADKTRLRILSALAISPMCVTDLSRILSLNQTTVSHQLRYLRAGGAVKSTRQGKILFYRLKDKAFSDFILQAIDYLN